MESRTWSDRSFGGVPSVSVAAHELKSPLALMRQLSLLLEEGQLDATEMRAIARQMTQVSERSLGLVSDLAQTAHLSPSLFPLEPVNPLALCQEMAAELRPAAALYKRTIEWPQRHASGRLMVANRTLCGRILANFIQNALRYSEQATPIKVLLQHRGSALRLGVRDYGPAMNLKEYRRLLDETERKKSVRTRPESSGLGVYVASQFARAMGGRVGLTRHRDGLTFYVELPISQQLSLL